MIYKKFYLISILRVLALTLTIFVFIQSFLTHLPVISVLLFGLMVYQVASLIWYVNKTNRELTNFLESIRFSEFSRSFKIEGLGTTFDDLNRVFNNVIKDFQQVRSEKEEHFHYLQSIVQNIDVSIIAFQKDGEVEMVNKAAKILFQVSHLKNIHILEALSYDLVNTLLNIKSGQNVLVKVQDEDDILQLAINATELKIRGKNITLATIKNIQNVLEEQETEAWQKLIRVLTHEIMNSITPIASLSSTIDSMLQTIASSYNINDPYNVTIEKESLEEIEQAILTINKRSVGLLHFVNTYRNLTKIPKPNFLIGSVTGLFRNIEQLLEEELKKNNIKLLTSVFPATIELSIDEQLMEQVLINLVKNAMNALEDRIEPMIEMKAFYNKRGRVTIQVIDNGVGILPEVLDKIFIPFFSTKPTGSGIGLSLSKQIIRLHNGIITASSVPEKETIFTITF